MYEQVIGSGKVEDVTVKQRYTSLTGLKGDSGAWRTHCDVMSVNECSATVFQAHISWDSSEEDRLVDREQFKEREDIFRLISISQK